MTIEQAAGRIIITTSSDAMEHGIEREGKDLRAIYHQNGLYYGYDDGKTKYNNRLELEYDMAQLAKVVLEEKAPVVVFGACDNQRVLPGSVEAAQFLLSRTDTKAVLVPIAKRNHERLRLEVFEFSREGLQLFDTWDGPLERPNEIVAALARRVRDRPFLKREAA